MNSLIHKTHLDYVQDYLERKESSNLPTWLQYLVLAEEVHQNFEHIDSLQELSTIRVIQYVYRTLVILEEKKDSFLTDEMYWQLAVQQTIKAALESAFEVLKPGGRMIIRDGIMSDDKKAKRNIRFKTDDGLPFLIQYAKDFKGRKINYEIQADNEVMMPINDSMEFLYTYTWGTESYAHEVNEQFGYFTPTEYRAFIQDIFGETAEIIKLEHYLQEGYTTHLNEKIDFKTEDGLPAPLPDSTCLLVIEKGAVK